MTEESPASQSFVPDDIVVALKAWVEGVLFYDEDRGLFVAYNPEKSRMEEVNLYVTARDWVNQQRAKR